MLGMLGRAEREREREERERERKKETHDPDRHVGDAVVAELVLEQGHLVEEEDRDVGAREEGDRDARVRRRGGEPLGFERGRGGRGGRRGRRRRGDAAAVEGRVGPVEGFLYGEVGRRAGCGLSVRGEKKISWLCRSCKDTVEDLERGTHPLDHSSACATRTAPAPGRASQPSPFLTAASMSSVFHSREKPEGAWWILSELLPKQISGRARSSLAEALRAREGAVSPRVGGEEREEEEEGTHASASGIERMGRLVAVTVQSSRWISRWPLSGSALSRGDEGMVGELRREVSEEALGRGA